MTGADEPLAAWHERLFLLLVFLEDLELKETGVPLDYSRDSLAAVERVVLDRFADPGQISWWTRRTFVEGLAAYIGETLMRRAGGAWTGESAVDGFPDGTPRVTADPALRLNPVSPVDLLRAAVGARDGGRFTQAIRDGIRTTAGGLTVLISSSLLTAGVGRHPGGRHVPRLDPDRGTDQEGAESRRLLCGNG